MRKAKIGDYVRVHYLIRLEDRSIYSGTFGEGPVVFKIGECKDMQGLDDIIVGMFPNEFKSVRFDAKNMVGDYDPRLVFVVRREELPKNVDIKIGMFLQRVKSDGSKEYLRIVNMHDDLVMLDANHPLAGRNLIMDVLLLDINDNIKDLLENFRYEWFKEKVNNIEDFEEELKRYERRDDKKILICVSAFNRRKMTELCLSQIQRYKAKNCFLQVYNDHSNEYNNDFLKNYADEVIQLPLKMGIHNLRIYQLKRFLESDFDLLYFTDNDVLHDPEFIKVLNFLYELGNKELPVCIYNSRFHAKPENVIFFKNGVSLRKTAPGVSMLYDKNMAERIIRYIDKIGSFLNDISWDYRIIAYLDKPFITTDISYLEHFGAEGIHNADFERDRAINPTFYLKSMRQNIINFLVNGEYLDIKF
jgi:peptidylprolyl isomerase